MPAMTTLMNTPANLAKSAQAERAWRDLLREALQRGFFGSVRMELQVQDGTIQLVRRRLERIER